MSRVTTQPQPQTRIGTPQTATGQVTHERIAQRAYEKWQKHGCHGRHMQDWIEAEAELRAESGSGNHGTSTRR